MVIYLGIINLVILLPEITASTLKVEKIEHVSCTIFFITKTKHFCYQHADNEGSIS
jgi:hypothetical protein